MYYAKSDRPLELYKNENYKLRCDFSLERKNRSAKTPRDVNRLERKQELVENLSLSTALCEWERKALAQNLSVLKNVGQPLGHHPLGCIRVATSHHKSRTGVVSRS